MESVSSKRTVRGDSRVLGLSFLSHLEMFAILSEGNMKYTGNEDGELGFGKGATVDPAVCISVPAQKCNGVGAEKSTKLKRTNLEQVIRPPRLYCAETIAIERRSSERTQNARYG